ncbi:MAG: maleylpyruvate isomerase family mycothiol-dependent enzyme [Acidimicrobiales bacterium]
MDHDSLVDAVRTEVQAMTLALDAGELDVPVPTCEGWEMSDLAVHVGNFCGFWAHVLCEGTGRPKPPLGDPPSGEQLVAWLADAAGALVAELEATPPDTHVWTWSDTDHTAAFVARRCAHELAIHRYDAQATRGMCAPIPVELAVDAVDEVLDVLAPARERTGHGTGRVMALRSTDVGLEWLVTLGRDRIHVDRRSQDDAPLDGSDIVVTSSASDLALTLYRRPTLSTTDVHGDYSVLDEWYREFTF